MLKENFNPVNKINIAIFTIFTIFTIFKINLNDNSSEQDH